MHDSKPLYFQFKNLLKKMCGGFFSFLKLADNVSGVGEGWLPQNLIRKTKLKI